MFNLLNVFLQSQNLHLKVIALEAVANAVTNNLEVSRAFINEQVLISTIYSLCGDEKLSKSVLLSFADILLNFAELKLISQIDSGLHTAYAIGSLKKVIYCEKSYIEFKGLVTLARLFEDSSLNQTLLKTYAKEKIVDLACRQLEQNLNEPLIHANMIQLLVHFSALEFEGDNQNLDQYLAKPEHLSLYL